MYPCSDTNFPIKDASLYEKTVSLLTRGVRGAEGLILFLGAGFFGIDSFTF
jgi:hypothetical protein